MDNERLDNLAHAVLDEVVGIFTAAGVDVPERSYVSDGSVEYECDTLAIETQRIYIGTTVQEVNREYREGDTLTVEFAIHIVRCVGAGIETPTVEQMHAAAHAKNVDGYVLLKGLIARIKSKQFLDDCPCQAAAVLNLSGAGPEGAIAGWVQGLRVTL